MNTLEWCAFSEESWEIVLVDKFREIILRFVRPKENFFFAIPDTKGFKLLFFHKIVTGLLPSSLQSYWNQYNDGDKFWHGFRDTIDPMCKCRLETETIICLPLCCRLYSTIRIARRNDIYTVVSSLKNYPDEQLLNILLYGSKYFSVTTNQSILKFRIKFLKSSSRFDDPLFLWNEEQELLLLCY